MTRSQLDGLVGGLALLRLIGLRTLACGTLVLFGFLMTTAIALVSVARDTIKGISRLSEWRSLDAPYSQVVGFYNYLIIEPLKLIGRATVEWFELFPRSWALVQSLEFTQFPNLNTILALALFILLMLAQVLATVLLLRLAAKGIWAAHSAIVKRGVARQAYTSLILLVLLPAFVGSISRISEWLFAIPDP